MTARRIVVVRHGETEWSAAGRHTSRTDLALTDDGRRRAVDLAGALGGPFVLVLCSPLLRARETCALAGYDEQAVIDENLREWDYGDYEGLTTPEIRASDPGWSLWRDGCPGGERPIDVEERADRALARLSEADGDALAFAHGHILRVVAARWIALKALGGANFALAAGAFGVLGYERETRVIEAWNLTPAG